VPDIAPGARKVEDGKENEKPPPPPIGKLLQVQFISCSAATRNTITLDPNHLHRMLAPGPHLRRPCLYARPLAAATKRAFSQVYYNGHYQYLNISPFHDQLAGPTLGLLRFTVVLGLISEASISQKYSIQWLYIEHILGRLLFRIWVRDAVSLLH